MQPDRSLTTFPASAGSRGPELRRRPLRGVRRLLAAPLFLATVGGCQGDPVPEPSLWSGPVEPGTREFLEVAWDTLWSHGGPEDTTLFTPRHLRPHPEGLLVWDAGASQLHFFHQERGYVWSMGSEGQGPHEFADVRDVEVDSDGNAYLFDRGNNRVTVVDPEGEIRHRIPLFDLPHSDPMALVGDTLLAFVASGAVERPIWVLDLEGHTRTRLDLPWDEFTDLHALSRQGRVVSRGDRWVFSFMLGNGWFAFQGLEAQDYLGGFVEHVEFPRLLAFSSGREETVRMAERPPFSAATLSLTDSLVVVHFGGRSQEEHQILDLYHWDDAAYLGSLLLPQEASRAVLAGDRAYTLTADPYPVVTALEAVGLGPAGP